MSLKSRCLPCEQTVLVTGGGGFLGGGIVERLLQEGHCVRSFSRGCYENLTARGVQHLRGNLADQEAVRKACQGCDLVFHVGAKAGIWGKYEDFFRANVLGTRNVIVGCREAGIRHLVYTSSPSVVFDGRDMEGVNETVPYPRQYVAAYPQTKAIAEKEVVAANSSNLKTVVLRPHLIWGPGDTQIIPGILERGRQGQLKRVGHLDKLVDFTFIDHAVQAHVLAAEKLLTGNIGGKVYFVSDGKPVVLWDFVNKILALAGLDPVRKTISPKLAYAAGWVLELSYRLLRLEGEPRLTRFLAKELSTAHWFDITSARRDLGYETTVSMEEGLEKLGHWLRGNGPAARE